MQLSLSYLPASQTIISSLLQSISPSLTESVSFRPSVPSQSNNISVGVSITTSPGLSLTTRESAITELSSQGGFLASSFSSLETRNSSLLTSESITLGALVTGFAFKRRAKKLTSKIHCLSLTLTLSIFWTDQSREKGASRLYIPY